MCWKSNAFHPALWISNAYLVSEEDKLKHSQMNWQCRPQAARPFIQRTRNNTDNRLLKKKHIKTCTTAAKTWEDPSKKNKQKQEVAFYLHQMQHIQAFLSFKVHRCPFRPRSSVDRKWQFPLLRMRPTRLPVSSYFIWFPTHFTPPLRWTLSSSDIKDLSETLSGLKYQSESRTPRLRSHTPMW